MLSFRPKVFCNRFAHMFLSFEHFVIVASDADLASMTPQQRETVQARHFIDLLQLVLALFIL